MKIKHIVYILLILAVGGLIAYRISANKEVSGPGGKPGGGKGGPGGGAQAMRVSGVVLQPQEFANSLSVTGSIEANEQIQIRGEVQGIVKKIFFKEDSHVKKGELLVKIDDAELRARLAETRTRQKLTAENARRAKLLLEKEAISREEHDVAQAELQSANAQVQLVEAQLAKTSIRAPFAGRIGLRNISEGTFLSPDVVIANLVSTDPVKITFAVPEKYANQVTVNSTITFTVAGTTEEFKATVYAIEPGIQETTRTLQLRARASNPDGKLRPGSFANIQLPLTIITDALLVPSQAVIPIQNGKKVFISRNGKAKEVIIETSTRTESDLLVTSGLSAGDTVLTTGIMALREGSPVQVKVTNVAPVSQNQQ